MASSNWPAIAIGHQLAPAASIPATSDGCDCFGARTADRDRCRTFGAIDVGSNVFVCHRIRCVAAFDAWQRLATRASRAIASLRKLGGAFLDHSRKLRGFRDRVDQTPFDGALTAHAFNARAENVGPIVSNVSLVSDSRHRSCSSSTKSVTGNDPEMSHFGPRGTGHRTSPRDLIKKDEGSAATRSLTLVNYSSTQTCHQEQV
jgi:hypothetical protein